MLFDLRPPSNRAFSEAAGCALLVLVSASFAALIAHIGIDVLGDYLLPHDSYDDVDHRSRSVVSCAVLLAVAGGALRVLFAALAQPRGLCDNRRVFASLNWFALAGYALLVSAATFGLLAGMELTDLTLAGQRVDDIGDLLGGSIALAAAVTVPVALVVAFGSWRIARWATQVQRVAIRVVGAWLAERARRIVATKVRCRRPSRSVVSVPALARSTSKRGPPTVLR